ncbi:hypothetical protein RugamoR64_14110 [Duganella rhizosphaerae]|uniref:4'-phosphopantetheinyl transferase family protein n=1 Tax=Duganella rhizosphaerae TaxID=2885763 RepID=UPI0030EAA81C
MRHSPPFGTTILPADAAVVWLARPGLHDPARLEARYLPLLDDDERARHRQLLRPADRHAYLAAHALQRLALAACTGLAPAQLRFRRGPRGKPSPELPAPHAALACNLSHTSGLVGCVLTRAGACGLDIETVRPLDDMEQIARLVCSPDELAQLAGLADHARQRRFFTLWTLKEAYAKATGEGIAIDLTRVAFAPDAQPLRCRLGAAPAGDDWRFHSEQLAGGHALAVALRGAAAGATVTLQEVRLDAAEPGNIAFSSTIHRLNLNA